MVLKRLCKKLWLIFLFQSIAMEKEDPSSKSGMAGYGVWYSADDILEVFNRREYMQMPGVRAVLSTYEDIVGKPPHNRTYSDPPVENRFPFIAIEGTHRDSRIIMGKELANYLQATYLGNPPRSMVPLRKMFDREKGMIRKAYFSLCMYVGGHHVRETWLREPVVTTGYWLDQAAFSIAQRFTLETLPPPGSPVYQWPDDLVRPDVAFFLNIPQLKWGDRPVNMFRPKLAEVYSRIKGVRIIEINQTGTYRKIFAIMRSRLHKMFKPLFRQTKQQEIEEEEKGLG
ncbi:UMP-CMP kinase 2, mitochondrial-like [Homalodisca vitripennis]|uniref:UMP-CMP kinase 2, mitochondrial-like n=1 Tax=Homalodisca vitripennis TaxID=197043 RepID=UPI001EEC2AF0|nr:UMP-CMP kinase 2, mitochondrial-like [Homalodisca vitripennis]